MTELLNADNLDAVLTLIESLGYHFVSPDQAMEDTAYNTPDEYAGSDGSSWLDGWQPALGHPERRPAAPQPPDWVEKDYDRITAVPKL